MRRIISFFLTVCFLMLSGSTLIANNTEEKLTIRRFAMGIGTNNGGPGRTKLKYAVSDAKTLLRVLKNMGGVHPEDIVLLTEPNSKTLLKSLHNLKEKINAARADHWRVEVIIYYSGHSDEKNLLLGNDKVSYKTFLDLINKMKADVRIAILDSCASGAFTRLKSGKKKPPFLMDSAYNMKGYAVMTSSSSDEVSQESDSLRGSYFTHYLVSGLRGAADMTRDGRITLNEAYQFAFKETLSETTKTISGPQHPNYNIQMKGTGDVVMTDIRTSSAILILHEDISGKIFIHNSKNVLVLELTKSSGYPVELGLEEGKYRVTVINEEYREGILEAQVSLHEGGSSTLEPESMKKTSREYTQIRGDLPKPEEKPLVKKRRKMNFYFDLSLKTTKIEGEGQLLFGGQFGFIFDNTFSIGVGGYGNISTASKYGVGSGKFMQEPITAYGGVILMYHFMPERKIHFRTGALLGAGTEGVTALGNFWIFEPEISLILDLSQKFKANFGISHRFVDYSRQDIDGFAFVCGIQYRIR